MGLFPVKYRTVCFRPFMSSAPLSSLRSIIRHLRRSNAPNAEKWEKYVIQQYRMSKMAGDSAAPILQAITTDVAGMLGEVEKHKENRRLETGLMEGMNEQERIRRSAHRVGLGVAQPYVEGVEDEKK